MGLYSAFDDAEAAHDSKKDDYKAEADYLNVAKAEKKTTESLLLKTEVGNLKKKMTTAAQAVLQLYANLLTEEARQPWDIIVKEQMESLPYTDIYGVERRKSPGKTTLSFCTCQLLHLQSCFSHDAGENLSFYISNCLKKPNKV